MKVLHISSSDGGGGAAIASLRIHLSQRRNIKSTMFVSNKVSGFEDVNTFNSDLIKFYTYAKTGIGKKISKLQVSDNKILHSVSCLPCFLDKYINKSSNDIINLHWVQNEMLSIEAIGRIKKPLVWTLHDAWPFSGSEHYPKDFLDQRFIKGYNNKNKPKGHKRFDLDKWCWDRKKKNWKKKMYIICPSNWLANCAKKSNLMQSWDINVIPNTLNTSKFKPWPKNIARKLFKLPLDKKIILFGAIGGTQQYIKGWDLLSKSLEFVYQEVPDAVAVVFGESKNNSWESMNIPLFFPGKLHDSESLSMLYSAADIMVVPSRMESFGQTASEASSCGTPVIAFNHSGLKDIISNNVTGYLVQPFDYKKLSNAIINLLNNNEKRKLFQIASRKKAKQSWSYSAVSKMYLELYERVLKEN